MKTVFGAFIAAMGAMMAIGTLTGPYPSAIVVLIGLLIATLGVTIMAVDMDGGK